MHWIKSQSEQTEGKTGSQAFVALIDYELQAKEHYISFIHKGYTMTANRQ